MPTVGGATLILKSENEEQRRIKARKRTTANRMLFPFFPFFYLTKALIKGTRLALGGR